MKIETQVLIKDARWDSYKIDFAKIVKTVVKFAADSKKYSAPEISIVLTGDSEIKKLNKEYRGINRPTNVLSFETGDSEMLGDIFISFDTVLKEASSENKSFSDHATHMVVHGVLHLLGYDHIKSADAGTMESVEVKILAALNIKNPYDENISVPDKNARAIIRLNSPLMNMIWLFLLGVLGSFGFAPFNLWWVTLISFGLAYFIFENNVKKRNANNAWKKFLCGFHSGFWFGSGYAVAMFWWVLNSIFIVPELAEIFAIWTIPGLVGIAIVGGVIFGLPFALTNMSGAKGASRPIIFACFWTFVLWLREWIFTGFPWNPLANIAMPWGTLANSMSVWGALGLTFIIVGFVASGTDFIRHVKTRARQSYLNNVIIFFVLLTIGIIAGHINISATKKHSVQDSIPVFRIVQPALTQSDKATHSREHLREQLKSNMDNLIKLSMTGVDSAAPDGAKFDIIIWPETSYPYVVAGDEFPAAKELGKIIIAGAMSYSDNKLYNSMVVADTKGFIAKIYDKAHLVPFGEYRPFGNLIPAPGHLAKGAGPEIISLGRWEKTISKSSVSKDSAGKIISEENKVTYHFFDDDLTFAPAICYEIVFSDSLVPRNARPDFIINLTNDTWFGATPGVYQHLDMTRRYAIESGLSIIRANYSGISAFIAPDGSIVSSLPLGVSGVLDGTVTGAHMTLYRLIGRNWWIVIIMAFSAVTLVAKRKE